MTKRSENFVHGKINNIKKSEIMKKILSTELFIVT